MKNLLNEIKFALENGFTKVEKIIEKDGSIAFVGTFGYVATTTIEEVEAIEKLITQYVKFEKTEAELLLEWEKENDGIVIEKLENPEVIAAPVIEGLTEKEEAVIRAMFECTIEFGLPVEVDEIKDITKYSKRTIVGVLSSLYKKKFVEEFKAEEYIKNEFMLSEVTYNKMSELLY